MDYRRYRISRDLAWRVLLHEGVTELPVKITALCKQMGIQVSYIDQVDDSDGYSTIFLGRARIFVSRNCTPERQRFTIAHELGHILLGHIGEYDLVNREPSPGDNPIEHEANVFASRLLAPACVLWALDVRTAKEIADICKISYQSASFRAERMTELYKRGKFLSSPLERKVYEQFSDYVQQKKRGHL